MDPARLSDIETLFHEASALPASERLAFVTARAQGDARLVRDVMAVLSSAGTDGAFDHLYSAMIPEDTTDPPLPPRIGAYVPVRPIGRGGMGTVYLAERADGQFERQVAIKVARDDLGDLEARKRFLAERQILAAITHPGIAGLLDGGVSSDGRPYFVMEYVDGRPIDRYCDENRLSIRQRLDLFLTVCAAVQYAHQNLIVHRDIKPGNILVGADGTPKLLDFGIAKLLPPEHEIGGARTRTGLRLMTPEYASPEQLSGGAVTTATDVYQLGVLLFELLTGRRPYALSGSSWPDAERMVMQTDPARPSTALTQPPRTGEVVDVESIVANRHATADRLRRTLRGDLDNIVLTALRREPTRRYASAQQLRDDVERYLNGLPITARPDSWTYRTTKFVRRHRVAVAAGITVAAGLVTVAVGASILAEQASRQRDRAERVSEMLTGLFESADPGVALGDDITVRQIIDRGVDRVRSDLAAEPLLQAELLQTLGHVYRNLGRLAEADSLVSDAVSLLRNADGAEPADLAKGITTLAIVRGDAGRGADMIPALDSAIDVLRQSGVSRRTDLASALNTRGYLLQIQGRFDEAAETYDDALATYRRRAQPGTLNESSTLVNLAWVHIQRRDLDRAEARLREARAIRRDSLDERNPRVATVLLALGQVALDRDQLDSAQHHMAEALQIRQVLFGPDHFYVGEALMFLAQVAGRRGDARTTDSLFARAIEIFDASPDAPRQLAARARNDWASMLRNRGATAEAAQLFREALQRYQDVHGNEHLSTAVVKTNLASALIALQRYGEVDSLYRQALSVLVASGSGGHQTAVAATDYALYLWQTDDRQGAFASLDDALDALSGFPDNDQELIRAKGILGSFLTLEGRYEQAEPLLIETFEILRRDRGMDFQYTRQSLETLIRFYELWERPEEAERYRTLRP